MTIDWNLSASEELGYERALEEEKRMTLGCPSCIHCGAVLPNDIPFQEYHMLRVHGLEVTHPGRIH
jgi:hypothetical protein